MKKATVAIVVVVILVIGGLGLWWLLSQHGPDTTGTQPATSNQMDETQSMSVEVKMRDLSFTPSSIKIKKGATVTWTNEDSVGHNVIADDATSTGGLPTSHPTFGKGQTFSMTFQTTGTFHYHCSAHPFMKGTIEVVD